MVKSMTAFAKKTHDADWGNLSIEIKTVNHRYLEFNFRLSEALREQEMILRNKIRSQIQRGKIDIAIKYEPRIGKETSLVLNHYLIKELLTAAEIIHSDYQLDGQLTSANLLMWPGVLQSTQQDLTHVLEALDSLFEACLQELYEARTREGEALSKHLLDRTNDIEKLIATIAPKIAPIIEEQKQKILAKCQSLDVDIDANRLAQEMILWAQRLDITEEVDRLSTHLQEIRRIIKAGGSVGRHLDFLIQELNREANTIGSKSIDSEMTQTVVTIKVLIEQMREQVQNLE